MPPIGGIMLIFGHLGIGKALINLLLRHLPAIGIMVGTLLPDLIDKTLYYSLCFLTGKSGLDLGLISGTRTFGHTGLFLIGLFLMAALTRSRVMIAIALGDLTHLLLDGISELASLFNGGEFSMEIFQPLFWPFSGWAFPVSSYDNITFHLVEKLMPFIVITELIGIAFLLRDYRRYYKSRKLK